MAKNLLLEASPLNSSGVLTTVRMSMSGVDASSVVVDGLQWLPVIVQGPTRDITLFDSGQVKEMTIDHGDISFRLHYEFNNLDWSNWSWDGQLARLYVGEQGAAWADYEQVFEGYMGPLQRDGAIAQVTLLGPDAILTQNMLTSTYSGSGGAEGPSTLQGQLKPRCYGDAYNVQAILIDPVYWIYQYHGYGPTQDVVMVYENAYEINATAKATYADYSTLQAATLAPGEWAKAPAVGMFRLGGQPNGAITCDLKGATTDGSYLNTIASIVPDMLKIAGVVGAQIDTAEFNNFNGYAWSLYLAQQATVGDTVHNAMTQVGGYLFPTSTGVWSCGNFFGARTPIALNAGRSTLPLVRNYNQPAPTAPNYRIRIGADHSWYVNSDSEISSALSDATVASSAAQEAASEALAQADAAMSRLDSIADDGVLDRSDKANVIREVSLIVAEKSGIDSTATALNLTTQKTTYDSAYSALVTTYLPSLTPAWDDTTQDTAIVAADFEASFQTYYLARQDVLISAAKLAAVTFYLTTPTISLPANAAGTVTSYDNANGRFVVNQGGKDVTEQCSFSVTDHTGTGLIWTLSNATGTKGQYAITGGWTENSPASLTMEAIFNGQTFKQILWITKALAGADGIGSVTGFLTNEAHVVVTDSDGNGADFTGAGGTFRMFNGLTEVTGSGVTYSVVSSSGVSISIASSGVYTITAMSADQGTAELKAVYNGVPVPYTYSIAKSKAGESTSGTNTWTPALVGAMSQNGSTFTSASGTNDLTFHNAMYSVEAGPGMTIACKLSQTNEQWAIGLDTSPSTMSTNVGDLDYYVLCDTDGSLTAAAGVASLASLGTASTTDVISLIHRGTTVDVLKNGIVIYTYTGVASGSNFHAVARAAGSGSINTVSVTFAGQTGAAGADGITLVVTGDRQTITYNAAGALDPTDQTINFQAFEQNTTLPVTWSLTDMDGVTQTASSYFSATTGSVVTISAANFDLARNGTKGVIVTGSIDTSPVLSDKISIVQVQAGPPGADGPPGEAGASGADGPAGRDAMVYYQASTSSPSGAILGDTWYQSDTKKWYRWSGSAWVQLLGNLAQYDQITASNVAAGTIAANAIGANQINVSSLSALTATIGTLRTSSSGARVEIKDNLISVYDSSNVLRVRIGIW